MIQRSRAIGVCNAALAMLALVLGCASAFAAPTYPAGRLPDTIRPTAYRLELTIDPAASEFSGHTEIDAVLARSTRTVFLHGRGLHVSRVLVTQAGHAPVTAHYREVDPTGVAELELPAELAAGPLTLSFDYRAAFRTGAEGLFHAEVAGDWYAWTQMEPIDARRMFPGFDEPGFKTPFSVTVTAPRNAKVFANAPELEAKDSGSSTVHRFAPTKPLPTYLVALGVGPFDVVETSVPANAQRASKLPFRVIATKGQLPRMRLAAAEGPKLLGMLEAYLGSAYPYEKLDFMASPVQGGAMENAGLILFEDSLILLDPQAPFSQLRDFGEVSAHEMSHQWFGDLVTPAWWTDIWLNESFAEWMGKKIADEWRPDLGIGTSRLQEAFAAMDVDSLGRGRPIRQQITRNRQIASAFDLITYQKGAQVVSMFESYLGPEKFAQGVRLHLSRYRFGNASADEFFRSLAEAAGDQKIVPAMRTFTDQTGVPVVTVEDLKQSITLAQARYRPLGVTAAGTQKWIIPVCLARGADHSCTVLDAPTASRPAMPGVGALVPNADGAGYYRYRLAPADWDRLIAAAPALHGRDALALADSLWAEFAAGGGSFASVVAGARSLSANPDFLAAVELAGRLKEVADTALDPSQVTEYRGLMRSIYGPRLMALGTDVRRGAYAREPADRQSLRQSLLPVVALEGRDPSLRQQLAQAADASLDGDANALDPAFALTALRVAVQDRGVPFMRKLAQALVKSGDPLFRDHASRALGSADTPALAREALDLALAPEMQSMESVRIVLPLSRQPGARSTLTAFSEQHFGKLIDRFPGFERPQFVRIYEGYCSKADVARVDEFVRPKLAQIGGGDLELSQVKERIGICASLKSAKGEEIAAVLASPGPVRTAMPRRPGEPR
jgi:aminopeptidase N